MCRTENTVVPNLFAARLVREKLEKEEEKGREAYKKITKWEQTPFWIKLKLTFGSFTCCLLVWIANMAYKRCFVKKFSITSRIECLPDGKVWNVIKPGGYIIIILFLVQIILLKLYYAWAKNAVSDYLADQKQNHPDQNLYLFQKLPLR